MQLAPIALFVYNRPWHTLQTLNALKQNALANQSALFIYADGPKPGADATDLQKIADTRNIIKCEKWCNEVTIIEATANRGLAGSIINGVTEMVNKYGRVIVLEDDLVTHPSFLTFMNTNLDIYEKNEKVISIHGYMYPVKKKISTPFFLKGADCWGWATWKRGWDMFETDAALLLREIEQKKLSKEFNFNNTCNYSSLLQNQVDNKIDSWAIRWYASAFLAGKLTLYPAKTLVHNIGLDGSGTHKDHAAAPIKSDFDFVLPEIEEIDAVENRRSKKAIERFFADQNSFSARLKSRVQSMLKPFKLA